MIEKKALQAFARESGADLIGVANIERFDPLPPAKHPRAIFPETRSVIVLGRRITRGSLRGVEEGANFQSYQMYGSDWLMNRFLALTTFQVAEFIEDHRWEAVPLQDLPPETPAMGVKVRKENPPPNVTLDLIDAAVRAGLGEIGYYGELVTPQFGARQRVQMILTDAQIEPDPIMKKEICPRDEAVKKACPLGAVKGEKTVEVCGKRMVVAALDRGTCGKCRNGAYPNPMHRAGQPDRLAALCVRTCMVHLEREKRIGNLFAHEFRKREPWTVRVEEDFYKA